MSISILSGHRQSGSGRSYEGVQTQNIASSLNRNEAVAAHSFTADCESLPCASMEPITSNMTNTTSGQPTNRGTRRHYSSSEGDSHPRRSRTWQQTRHDPIEFPNFTPSTSIAYDLRQRKRHLQQRSVGCTFRGSAKRIKIPYTKPREGAESSSAPIISRRRGGGRRRPLQQPKAPSNTSTFLIKDREERESIDNLSDTPNEESSNANTVSDGTSSDGGEETEQHDPEFALEYDISSLERIKALSRDQINREMLEVEKKNRHLAGRLGHLKCENHRLKNLLHKHGIEYGNPPHVATPSQQQEIPIAPATSFTKRSRSTGEYEVLNTAKNAVGK